MHTTDSQPDPNTILADPRTDGAIGFAIGECAPHSILIARSERGIGAIATVAYPVIAGPPIANTCCCNVRPAHECT